MSNWSKPYSNITWANDSSPYLNASNLNANQGWIKELKDRTEELYVRSSASKQAEIEALAEQCQADAVSADADAKSAEQFANLASTSATTATSAVSTVTTAVELAQASATSASASATSASASESSASSNAIEAQRCAISSTSSAELAKSCANRSESAEKKIRAEVFGTAEDTLLWTGTVTSSKKDIVISDGALTDDCPIETVTIGSAGSYESVDMVPVDALKKIGLKISIANGTSAIAVFSIIQVYGTRRVELQSAVPFSSGDTISIPSDVEYFRGISTGDDVSQYGTIDVTYPATFSLYMLPVYSIGTLTDEARDAANRAEAAAEILEGFDGTASTVGYDGSASGLDADNVQDAIDKIGTNVVVLTSADNLNNVTDVTKKYYAGDGSFPANSPVTTSNFTMKVEYDSSGASARRRQIVTLVAKNVRYERTYVNSTWSAWVKEDFDRIAFVGTRNYNMVTSYTLPTGVWTKVCTITDLPYGQYLCYGTCSFKANGSAGYRRFKVSNKETGGDNATTAGIGSGSTVNEDSLNGVTVMTLSAANPNVNLWVYQNSGANVTLSFPTVSAIRIN